MSNYGSWKIDDALTFTANTHDPSDGSASDADSAPTYRVYEDETATPILTGTMALLDTSNTTGFYSEQITLSAANGFEQGKSYTIYITATVATVAGTISHNFQIQAEVNTAQIANAVWDEPLADHDTEDTVGNVFNDLTEESSGTYRFTSAALQSTLGAGATAFTYTLTSSVDASPIADAEVWVTSDSAGDNLLASGTTDNNGQVTFYLDAGTVYVWRKKAGWNFTNPDTETVS